MRYPVRNFVRVLGIIWIGIVLVSGVTLSAYASDNSAADSSAGTQNDSIPLLPVEDLTGESAALTVHLTYDDEDAGKTVAVAGAVIDLFKAVDLVTENGAAHYILTDAFASSGIDFEGMTASESLAAAEKLSALADRNQIQPTATATSNDQGSAVFSDLTPGMYLGRQREAVQISATKKVTMEPVLWMTPMYVLNDTQDAFVWNYTSEVYPKEAGVEKIPTPTVTPTVTPTLTSKLTVTPVTKKTPTATVKPSTSSGTTQVKTGDTSPIACYHSREEVGLKSSFDSL